MVAWEVLGSLPTMEKEITENFIIIIQSGNTELNKEFLHIPDSFRLEKCDFQTKTKGFTNKFLCNLFCKTVNTLDYLIQFNLDRPIIKGNSMLKRVCL